MSVGLSRPVRPQKLATSLLANQMPPNFSHSSSSNRGSADWRPLICWIPAKHAGAGLLASVVDLPSQVSTFDASLCLLLRQFPPRPFPFLFPKHAMEIGKASSTKDSCILYERILPDKENVSFRSTNYR